MCKRIAVLSACVIISFAVLLITFTNIARKCKGATALLSNAQNLPAGTSVIARDALITQPIGGLDKTDASKEIISVTGQPFDKALRATIRKTSAETNATQMTIPNITYIEKGDVLYISVYVRGSEKPAQTLVMLERSVSPWEKSVSLSAAAPKNPREWKRYIIPFQSVDTYQPYQAMVSLRLAFGPQTIDIGGLSVINLGKNMAYDELVKKVGLANPLGDVKVEINPSVKYQKIIGLGGNFCQARYGLTEAFDLVGRYNLDHLHVAQARIGIPLNNWVPDPPVDGVLQYRDNAQPHAAFLAMQEMARRKIPIIGTVWEGPVWMLGGYAEERHRTLSKDKYDLCIEAIAQFLVTARDKYGASVDYYSFNEPDWGVNFYFPPQEMADFIRQAGKRFDALGLKTKFLVGDTTGGSPFVDYANVLLSDKSISKYLGPLAFHCWDALSSSDAAYAKIGELMRSSGKTLYCTEGGYDSALWHKPNPWQPWDNGLFTAQAYVKTLRLTGASTIDYWTYEDNYPIISSDGKTPYGIFYTLKQLEDALPKGATVVSTLSDNEDLSAVAVIGPGRKQYSVIMVNTKGSGTVAISGLSGNRTVNIWVSNDNAQNKLVNSNVSVPKSGMLTLPVTPRSVVTITSI